MAKETVKTAFKVGLHGVETAATPWSVAAVNNLNSFVTNAIEPTNA